MKIILHVVMLVMVGLFFLSLPTPTLAQDTPPFVTCNGPDCTICSLTTSINNIIQFTVTLAVILATIILAYSGFKLVFSKGDSGAINQAKTHLINTVIGIILILAAWTLVDTLIKVFVNNQVIGENTPYGPWHSIDPAQCRGQNPTGAPVTEVPRVGANINTFDFSTDINSSGEMITESGIAGSPTSPPPVVTGNLVTYEGRQFDASIIANVQHLDTNFDLRVSGGYRSPERNAAVGGVANSYHLTGRAADFVGPMSAMEAGRDWARRNGAREALIHNVGSGTHLHVAW